MRLRLPLGLAAVILSCFSAINVSYSAEYAWVGGISAGGWQVIQGGNWRDMSGAALTQQYMGDVWGINDANTMYIGAPGVAVAAGGDNLNINNLGTVGNPTGVGIGGLVINSDVVKTMHSSDNKILFLNAGAGDECLLDIRHNFIIGRTLTASNVVSAIQINSDVRIKLADNVKLELVKLSGGEGKTITVEGSKSGNADGSDITKNVVAIVDALPDALKANWLIKGGAVLSVDGRIIANALGSGKISLDNGSIRFGQEGAVANDFEILSGHFYHNGGVATGKNLKFTGKFSGSGNVIMGGTNIGEIWTMVGDNSGFSGEWVINRNAGGAASLRFGDGTVAAPSSATAIAGSGKINGGTDSQVQFNYSGLAPVATQVVGTLKVNHVGSGTLYLSNAANTYDGGTYVTNGGGIRLGTAGKASYGTGPVDLVSGGGVDVDAAAGNLVVSDWDLRSGGAWSVGVGSGQTLTLGLSSAAPSVRTGAVTKKGAGEVIVSEGLLSTAAANLVVEAGTITFGTGTQTASFVDNVSSVALGSGGKYGLNLSGDVTYAGNITGTGKVRVEGGGTYQLSGANTFTGDLEVGNGTTILLQGENDLGKASRVVMENAVLKVLADNTMASALAGSGKVIVNDNVHLKTSSFIANTSQAGTIQLEMGSDSKITFTPSLGIQYLASLSIDGTATFDFAGREDIVLNIDAPINVANTGDYLVVDNYNYNGTYNYIAYNSGLASWAELDDIKIMTSSGLKSAMMNASGQVVLFDASVSAGDLQVHDQPYTYTQTKKYFGSMAGDGVLTFTHELSFANGADPIYGFTTRNDSSSGTPANSFTVDSLLVNGSGNQARGVSVIGYAGQESRWVALGNTGNTFSGDLHAQSVTVRAVADVVGTVNQADMTTLGSGNTIRLTTNATLVLDSERKSDGTASGLTGDFTYKNNIQFGQNNVYVRQESGNHTLSGDINLLGVGQKVVENAVDNSTLTLTGTITGKTGSSALTLKTLASPDSKIILALNSDNSLVQDLGIEGNVELTSGTLTSTGGMSLGTADSRLYLAGGTLALGGAITGTSGAAIVFGDGGTLKAVENMEVPSTVTLDASGLASGETFTFDTNGYQMIINKEIPGVASGAILRKAGDGELVFNNDVTGTGQLLLEGGKTTLQSAGNTFDTIQVMGGSELSVNGAVTVARDLVSYGKISGAGSINTGSIHFNSGGEYAGAMTNQQWSAEFDSGATFNGMLETSGDVEFAKGSRFIGVGDLDTGATPPAPLYNPSLVSTNGGSVTLNGVLVSGNTTTPVGYWDQGAEYTFVLIQTESGHLLGFDGDVLNDFNFKNSASMETAAWGAFMSGVLGFVEGEQLTVTLTRNSVYTTDFAQTENQYAVGTGLNYAMDYYKSLGLAGTELDKVIRYFNAMGDDIAAQAPATLEMLGGLSAYQTVAGQRTDLLRHVDAVNRRAQAGGKGVNLHRKDPANQFWVEATQSFQQVDSMSGSPGYEVSTWGGAIGVDFVSAAHYSLGVGFAYSNINVSSDEYSAKSVGDALYLDLYGRFEKGPWSGTFVLSGGTTDFEVKRSVIMGDDYYNVKADPTGKQIMGMVELAYAQALTSDGLYLEPNVRLSVGTTELDGYSEEGFGNAGLDVSKHKMNILQGAIGVRLFQQKIDTYMEYETSRWEVRAGLVQEMGDKEYTTTSRFIGAPVDFQTKGSDVGATGFQIGGSISSSFDNNWSWFGDVNAEFRKGVMGMDSVLGLRCTF